MSKNTASSIKRHIKSLSTAEKFKDSAQADFLILIGKLLKNGFSLDQAIRCLQLVSKTPAIFEKIYLDLQSGAMLSTALRHLKLPTVVQNQLVIAEMSGQLQQTATQCGLILKDKAKQKSKLRDLLAYPIFILSFLTLMTIGMKLYILPQLSSAGGDNAMDLILGLFFGGIALVVTIIIGIVIRLTRMSEYQRAHFLVKVPLLKKPYLDFYHFTLLQGWGMQFSEGMDLRKICLNNQNFVDGSIQAQIAQKVLTSLYQGIDLRKLINEEPLLPNELSIILAMGGGTNEVSQDLLMLADIKFDETQKSIKKILNLVQPILFAIIASFILIAYLMILLPVYGMMRGMN